MDIVPETINRIRLSDNELVLLSRVLEKINCNNLSDNEKEFYRILSGRIKGRLKLKEEIN